MDPVNHTGTSSRRVDPKYKGYTRGTKDSAYREGTTYDDVRGNMTGLLQSNRQAIHQMRKEVQAMKHMITVLSRGGAPESLQEEEKRKFVEAIDRARLRLDSERARGAELELELRDLSEKEVDVIVESQDVYPEETPTAQHIRLLENRLDKALIKYNEAQAIRRTYEHIVDRLKEERVGFDNQLVAIERTLKAKSHDYQELLNMSHDANHAKEVAKAELQQFKAAYLEERHQKEQELAARKAYVQKRIDQTQALEWKEKHMVNVAMEEARKREAQRQKLLQVRNTEDVLAPEERERLEEYERAFKAIKEATGVQDVHEVIQKYLTQQETHRNLSELIQEAQVRIDHLGTQKLELKARLEELKYSGSGQLGTRRIVDEFEAHLEEVQRHGEEQRMRQEMLTKILIRFRAGVEHLVQRLQRMQGGSLKMGNDLLTQLNSSTSTVANPTLALTDENLVEVLRACAQRVRCIVESVPLPSTMSPSMMSMSSSTVVTGNTTTNLSASVHTGASSQTSLQLIPITRLPPHNRRIRLEGDEDMLNEADLGAKEDEEGGDENDVFNREQVKRISYLAVERETKKQRKKKRGQDLAL